MTEQLERLKRRVNRERSARKEAEKLLEEKSLALFNANRALQQAHDELEARVHERTAELKTSNNKLRQEIIERQKIEATLAQTRDKALEASRLKSEFLANMSHEIRTPLNAIIGLTNLLLDTQLNFEQRDFLQTVDTSGNALLAIINDILDFSRIEANKLDLEKHPLVLRECVEEAIDLLAQKAFDKDLELAYFMKSPMPELFIGDITRLRQILVNLLNNALKFTSEGEVVVFIEATPQANNMYELHFAVRDTGIGIPHDRLNQLFDSFSQVDTSTTRKYGGTGLGLAISKRLTSMMDGKMWVESEVGVGSTFHFTIVAEALDEKNALLIQEPQKDLEGLAVLIVDDNATNRLILCGQTGAWGMEPTAVSSGQEALDLLNSDYQCDIAILDMQMPEMDGVMLAQEIKQQTALKPFPMIMLSSIGARPTSSTSKLFSSYATKPVKPTLLRRALLLAKNGENTLTHVKSQEETKNQIAARLPLRILLTEDNLINQKVALNMFKRFGYRPDIAGNGLEAIYALRRQPYDVIFMDIQMPEMDGVTATKRINEEWGANRPRIIAMTANAMAGDRERFLSAGMDDYISKPVKIKELENAIKQCKPNLSNEESH